MLIDFDVVRLATELDAAKADPIRSELPPFAAYAIASLLQLAVTHPRLPEHVRAIGQKAARDLQEALRSRSAYAAELLEEGWQR